MKKVVLVIIISIISFFIFLELYYACTICYESKKNSIKDPHFTIKIRYHKPYASNFINIFWDEIKSRYYDKKSDKTIMLLGCSYAEGAGLSLEQNPAAMLSNLTNFNVINAAFGGHGIQSSYKFLSDYKERKSQNCNIDYFVYVYMEDHLRRFYERYNWLNGEIYPNYKLDKNNKFVEVKPIFSFIYSSFVIQNINNEIMYKKYEEEKHNYKTFNLFVSEFQKLQKKTYPHSQFIILVVPVKYTHKVYAEDSMFPEYEQKKLNEMGIQIINAEQLTNENLRDEKWYIEDKCHPSFQYWSLILPKFSKIIKNEELSQ